MPAARRQLWMVALAFVILGVGVSIVYFRMRSGDIQLAQGRQLYDAGKYELAEMAYRRATEAEPMNAEAWYWLGISCKNQGKDKEAADALAKATELRPKDVNWWFDCAEALQWANRFDKAEAAWGQVLALLPPEDNRVRKAQINLARVLAAQHKTDQAIDLLSKVLAHSEDRQVRFVLAELLGYAGRFEESTKEYSRALGDQPASKPEK